MKPVTRTAETTLAIRGVVDLDHPGTEGADGDGEVEIRVQMRGDSLRIHVSIIVPVDGQDGDANMTFVANVENGQLPELFGFERTIRAMSGDDEECPS